MTDTGMLRGAAPCGLRVPCAPQHLHHSAHVCRRQHRPVQECQARPPGRIGVMHAQGAARRAITPPVLDAAADSRPQDGTIAPDS